MTSIVDALPMPMPSPTSSAPSPTGAPGVPPEELSEEIVDAAAPADAFAALLAAVVATVMPQVATDVPTGEPMVVPEGAPEVTAPTTPVVGASAPVDVAPVLSHLHANRVVAAAAPPAMTTAEAVVVEPGAMPVVVEQAPVEAPLPIAPEPVLEAATAPETAIEAAPAPQPELAPAPVPQPAAETTELTDTEPGTTAPAVDLPEAVTPVLTVAATSAPVEETVPEMAQPSVETPSNLQPVGTTRTTSIESVPVPASPAPAPPPPAQQVVTHISPLLERPDGTYELSLRLHPDELGGVHVEVRMQGGEVSLQLRAETQIGHATLRDSLPALRAELEAAGVNAGSLDLGAWGNGQGDSQEAPDRRPGTVTPFSIDTAPTEADPTPATDGDAAVDVRI